MKMEAAKFFEINEQFAIIEKKINVI